jgi:ribosomal protein S18 acetylase RimI-like enzyme
MASPTVPRLRTYRDADAPFVEKLAHAAFGEYSPRAGAPSVRAATLPGVVAIVAVGAPDPIGFAMLTIHATKAAPFASLDAIAVDEKERGRGVGKALLAGAERAAKKHRVKEIRLVTAESNVAALDLFLRSGFSIVERLERYYPRGQNAVAMRKRLAP